MSITRRLRFEILRRDDHTCRYCGAKAPDVKLTVDHVTPRALGGRDEPDNLVTACQPCNTGKSSVSPGERVVADVADDAIRWARARHEAVASWRAERIALAADLAAFSDAWDEWTTGKDEDKAPVPREDDWGAAVERWLDAGFIIEDLIELIPKAMHNRPSRGGPIAIDERWRYYCGVVWRTLDDIEADTRSKLAPSTAPRTEEPDEAYNAGFEDGRAYERSRLDIGIGLCGECRERPSAGPAGPCTDCWGD